MSKKKTQRTEHANKGNCFERAYHLLVDGHWCLEILPAILGEPLLVHGIVWHVQTGWHVHAWIEDEVFAYDFIGHSLRPITKSIYYSVGKIKTGDGEIMKYTAQQAEDRAADAGIYDFSNLPCKQ